MKKTVNDEGVRTRLILAALDELMVHGVSDFSLRRVASIAQVSCAAPYRHFKDKDELIAETAEYIISKWSLLTDQIITAYGNDPKRALVALCVAAVQFWVANGNFRSLLIPEQGSELSERMKRFDEPILRYVEKASASSDLDATEKTQKLVLSLVYGTVVLVATGKISSDTATSALSDEIVSLL